MSHLHERKEKNCLNCETIVAGRYCQNCGQENIEPRETTGHLIRHFIEDITHFDGKLLITLKYLFFKPGFLTAEYMRGKRVSYINPIRMYLFISALFFLLYMAFFAHENPGIMTSRSSSQVHSNTQNVAADTLRQDVKTLHTVQFGDRTEIWEATPEEYDSVQNSLPSNKRDNIIGHYLKRKIIAAMAYTENDKDDWQDKVMAKFYHSLPYMLFISLPVIALLLQLLYIRRRKEYYYVSHAIFTIHFYCLVFLAQLAALTAGRLGSFGSTTAFIIWLGIILYLLAAMHNFYKQGWFKTIIKCFLFVGIGSLFVGILTLIFIFISFMNLTH